MKRPIFTMLALGSLISCAQDATGSQVDADATTPSTDPDTEEDVTGDNDEVISPSPVSKPNIVLFLVDDMGWQDTSVPFHTSESVWNTRFKTPNMERMAEKGVMFTNAYANSISSPSRVSLMTGVNVTRHKVSNWTFFEDTSTDSTNATLSFEDWNVNGFTLDGSVDRAYHATSFPSILQKNGYSTFSVGKAHFGAVDTPSEDPCNVGFDVNIAGHAAGSQGSYLGENNYAVPYTTATSSYYAVPNLEDYHGTHTFLTEALTLEAVKLMDQSVEEDKPFFLYMSHYAVHTAYDADDRFSQYYEDLGWETTEVEYASIVEGMDKSLGDIMDYLEEKGIADNTIVLFMSDNGGYSVGVRSTTFNSAPKNDPLRGGKGALYEGGIREPMMAYVPGVTIGGTKNDSPIIIEDFFPTILELAGVVGTTVQPLDSKSFVPAIKGMSINSDRPLYWHYPNCWGEVTADCGMPASALRMGNMKLVHKYETGTNELYDISSDIGETTDLADNANYASVLAEMTKTLSDKLRAESATMPVFKSNNQRCAYPDGTY